MDMSNLRGERLERAYEELRSSENNHSLLKTCLSPEIFRHLRCRTYARGSGLFEIIKSGIANPDSKIGVYAIDADSYQHFAPLFDLVIEAYHRVDLRTLQDDTAKSFRTVKIPSFSNSAKSRVLSTRVRACRSLSGYPFHLLMTQNDYADIESQFCEAANDLPAHLSGTYTAMSELSDEEFNDLNRRKILFPPAATDRFLRAASADRFHPIGRGAFTNTTGTFIAWVNEEDHFRFMSVRKDADLAKTFELFNQYLKWFEKRLCFAYDKKLGYLNFCPTNIGCTIRASVHVRLPKIGRDVHKLESLASMHNLQVRGVGGENSAIGGEIFDISNARRLGLSAAEAVRDMQKGVEALVRIEDQM